MNRKEECCNNPNEKELSMKGRKSYREEWTVMYFRAGENGVEAHVTRVLLLPIIIIIVHLYGAPCIASEAPWFLV